jgi:hypothetical protein
LGVVTGCHEISPLGGLLCAQNYQAYGRIILKGVSRTSAAANWKSFKNRLR